MELFKKAFINEHKQFHRLSKQGQKFALSIFLYNLINPIFAIFISAFLWRQTQDVMIVTLFSLATFCMLPFGFYLNGQLLKHISVKRLYWAGTVLRSSLVALLIFFPAVNQLAVILFGIGYGLTSGIFFSNKDLLTVELTTSSNRIYFLSLDFISQTLTNIIIPSAIGVLLVLGANNNLYTAKEGYYVVAIIMILLSVYTGSLIKKINVKTPDISTIVLQNGTKQWNCARGIYGLLGLVTGVSTFLPVLIVLNYIGKEDTLGIVQSTTAIISGVIMYTIARSINTRFRVKMIGISVMIMILGSTILALFFNPTGIFIYIAALTLSLHLIIAEINSVIFDLIDRENVGQDNKYMYVFDLEMVLNIGRVTGIMFFVFYIKTFSLDFAMHYTPLFFSIALAAVVILAHAIESRKEVGANEELVEFYAQNKPQ